MQLHRATVLSGLVLAACSGCGDGANTVAPGGVNASPERPSFTAGSGSVSTLLGRATFFDPKDDVFKVKRITGDWHAEVKAKPALDVAVQSITFPPGSHSGWHGHPGPVFIQVVSGTMTFYESHDPDCTPTVRTAGQAYLDIGDHAHIARNESGVPAVNIVTYLAPPGAALRIDKPNPGNCPF